MKKSLKSDNIGKNTILYLLALVFSKVLSVIFMPILSNCLEPWEYGITNYTTSFTTFLAVFSALGLNSYFLIEYTKAKDKKELNGSLFWFLTLWNGFLCLIVGIALYFLWPAMRMSFDYWPYIPMALFSHFFFVTDLIPMRLYRMRGEVIYYFIRVVSKAVLTYGLTMLFVVVMKKGVIGNYWAGIIGNVLFGIFFIIYMARHSHFRINIKIIKDGLRFGIPLIPSGIAANGTSIITANLTEKLLTLAQLGVYSIGNSIASIINMVTQSIALAVEPEFYLKSGTDGYNEFVKKLKDYQLVVVGWFCVGCGTFIREAIRILHINQKYWDAVTVVQVMSISYLVTILVSTYTSQILLKKKTKLLLLVNLSALAVLVGAEWVLLPLTGIDGIGYATIICNLYTFAVLYFAEGRKILHNMNLKKDFIVMICEAALIYLSRAADNFSSAVVSAAVKLVAFAVFTVILLTVYHIGVRDIVGFVFRKKKVK